MNFVREKKTGKILVGFVGKSGSFVYMANPLATAGIAATEYAELEPALALAELLFNELNGSEIVGNSQELFNELECFIESHKPKKPVEISIPDEAWIDGNDIPETGYIVFDNMHGQRIVGHSATTNKKAVKRYCPIVIKEGE